MANRGAMQMLKMTLLGMVKGKIGVCVACWLGNLKQEKLEASQQLEAERLQQALGDLSQSEALKLLKKLLWVMMKGQLGQLFMAWRDTQRAEHEQAALDKLKAMANRGAMQMLKMTLLGMVKGKIGVCVACWLGNLKQEKLEASQQLEAERLQQALGDLSQSEAL